MQSESNSKKSYQDGQENDGFLLPVLVAVWREWRSLLYLNFTLDLFIVFPTLLIMGTALAWPVAVLIILTVLSAVSVLSVPAALTAAGRITVSIVRKENVFVVHDFWKTFAENYFKSMLGGLFFAAVLGLLIFSAFCSYSLFGTGTLFLILFAIVLAMCVVIFTASLYFFPMLSLIDLPVKPILKNSLLIVPAAWKRSLLAILATAVTAIFLCCFTVGTALFLAGLFFTALYLLLVSFAIYPAISRLVILRQSPKKTGTLIKQVDGKVLSWEEEDTETAPEEKEPEKEEEAVTEEETEVKPVLKWDD